MTAEHGFTKPGEVIPIEELSCMPGVQIKIDKTPNLIDELTDLCELWKKNRDKGHTPRGIKCAIMNVVYELENEEPNPFKGIR